MIWQVQDLEERIFLDTRQMLFRSGVLNEQDNYPLQMMLSYDYLARTHLRAVYCLSFLAQEAIHILKCNKQMLHIRKQPAGGLRRVPNLPISEHYVPGYGRYFLGFLNPWDLL